ERRAKSVGDGFEAVCCALSCDADRPDPDRLSVSGVRRQGALPLTGRRDAGRDQARPCGAVLSALRGGHPGLRQRAAWGDVAIDAALRGLVRTILLRDVRAHRARAFETMDLAGGCGRCVMGDVHDGVVVDIGPLDRRPYRTAGVTRKARNARGSETKVP